MVDRTRHTESQAGVSGIEALLREVHSLDASAGRSTWLARLDPRAIVLATVAFIIVVVSFDRYAVVALLPLTLYPLVLARLGNIPLGRIGRKLLPALPFALMVGLFNPLFDPTPRIELMGHAIAGGWLSLSSILLRAILTVSAALILIAVLGMHRLCAALDQLGVPHVLTTQLLLMHRYLLVLAGELGRMNLARELRAPAPRAMPLSVYASLLGHLLLRTLDRALRIHQAMRARGFDGRLPLRHAQFWQWTDTAFLAACLSMFVLMRGCAA
jgi:cobalt/nickel transport system permease protein